MAQVWESFALLVDMVRDGVFWITVEGNNVLFLVTRAGSLGTGVLSFGSLSVSSGFWKCRFFFSSESTESIRLPYLSDFPSLRSL